MAALAAVLATGGCGLDPSQKDRCATNADCNPGRVCVSSACEDSGPRNAGCGTHDFDGDGHSDILWYDQATGAMRIWFMEGAAHLGSTDLDPMPDLELASGRRVVGVGDFNQDGHPDIVVRDGTSGVTEVWYMNGPIVTDVQDLDPSLNLTDDTGWSLVGICDFDQDGWPDLLWHNGQYATTQLWYMHDHTRTGYANMDGTSTSVLDASGWQIVGTGDFNHDGKPDILWRGMGGEATVWVMDGLAFASNEGISAQSADPQNMILSEADDLDRDGSSDLVWWRPTTGTVEVWLMNGLSRATTADTGGAPDSAGWVIVPH